MRDKVEEVIQVIRPAIQADKGDLFLRDVNEETGLVSVELVGACVGCPASTLTLKAGIQRILKDRVPGVTEVIDVGQIGMGEGGAAAGAVGGRTTSPVADAEPSETVVSL